MPRKLPVYILLTIVTAMLAGCGSSKSASSGGGKTYVAAKGKSSQYKFPSYDSPQANALIDEAKSWLGTPYRYGGTDRKGVDCSGFVLNVYKNALGISLPRTSRDQHDFCSRVSQSSLVPGDLLFFSSDKTQGTVTHVGIFVGDNRMIHASSSSGVIVTDITSSYYKRNYKACGSVDQYHAMLGKKKKSKKSSKEKDEPTQIKNEPEVHIAQRESPAGFSLTPVEGLPQLKSRSAAAARADSKAASDVKSKSKTTSKGKSKAEAKAESKSKSKNKAKDKAAASTVNTVTVSDTPVSAAEPTAAEARAAVLSSIKEKDI